MATGKIEIPQRKNKRNSWKDALSILKAKKDLLFKRRHKKSDEEVGDPVYHLLRCAASPGHQPSSCKCICHIENDEDCHQVMTEMSTPINVLCAPAARRKSPHHVGSTHPSSLPSLRPTEQNITLSPSASNYISKRKSSHISLPNILSRKIKSRNSGCRTSTYDDQKSPGSNFKSGSAFSTYHTNTPVFTFDSG